MQEHNEQCRCEKYSTANARNEAPNALTTIIDFINFYDSPEAIKDELWQLLSMYIGSPETENVSHVDRANQMLLYKQLCELVESIYFIYHHKQA